jgi:SNF2 family DNA or RNA helicase
VTAEDLAPVAEEEAIVANREAKISSVHEDFSQMGDLSRLLRLTGEAKVRAAVDFVADLADTAGKVVVFAYHREVMARLRKGLEARHLGCVSYHGGMSDTQKQEAVAAFQEPTYRVFIGQIQAAGTGINGLQAVCSHVVFAELSWVPGVTGQAVDRLHRIGQTASCVNVYFLHAPGTLESAVLSTHDRKEAIIEKLMRP